ncbi:MAG: hypothetical protein QMC85_06565 [Methanocellales archaeon]|nr:hypothetical protein [Methanocellales archaeon]
MEGFTTVQVSRSTAERLREIGGTYDEAIRKVTEKPQVSKVLSFRKTVAKLESDHEDNRVPFDGIVTSVIMQFPAGCNFLVDVRLLYRVADHEYYIIPSVEDQFIALDDATPTFHTSYPVSVGNTLRAEWYNYDDTYSHTVPVIVTMMSKPIPVAERI